MARKIQQARKKKQPKKPKPVEEEEVVEEVVEDDQIESDESGDITPVDTSDSESESDVEEDVAASLFKGQEEESESADDDDSDGEENTKRSSSALQSEAYTFDLRNMLAINTDQLAMGTLYDSKKNAKSKKDLEIPLDPIRGASLEVNEEYLLSKVTDGCTQLIRSLWELPTEVSDAGPLVTLPTYDEVRLPRAMVSSCSATTIVFLWLFN